MCGNTCRVCAKVSLVRTPSHEAAQLVARRGAETAEGGFTAKIANEYLIQLNREIKEVRGEMNQYGLV